MKLYTEEQIKEAIKMAREGVRSEVNIINSLNFIKPTIELPSDSLCINCDESKSTHNVCMDCIIKIGRQNIQLPSDEEISEEVKFYDERWEIRQAIEFGAKLICDKIQGKHIGDVNKMVGDEQ